jgi:putative ABC transport system substrate-binding protein
VRVLEPGRHMRFNRLRRREFIKLLGGAATSWPLAAGAETNRLRRIGVLLNGPENNTEMRAEVFALQKGHSLPVQFLF